MPSRLCTANTSVRARPHPRNPRAHPPPTPRSRRPDRRPVPHGLTAGSRSQPRRHRRAIEEEAPDQGDARTDRSSRRTRIFTPSTRNSTIRPRHPPPRRRNLSPAPAAAPAAPAAGGLSDVCCVPRGQVPPRQLCVLSQGRLRGDSNLPADATETVTTPPPTPGAAIGLALRVGILTVSDRAHARVYEDESGPLDRLAMLRARVGDGCVPRLLHAQVHRPGREGVDRGADQGDDRGCVTSCSPSGGTGCAPRDVTPEATAAVLHRMIPGIPAATRGRVASDNPTPRYRERWRGFGTERWSSTSRARPSAFS